MLNMRNRKKSYAISLRAQCTWAAVLLCVMLPRTALGQEQEAAPRTIEELRAAIDVARNRAESNPSDPRALCRLGALLVNGGRYDEAEERLRGALELEPSLAEGLLALTELAWRRNRYKEMEERLAKASALSFEDTRFRIWEIKLARIKMDYGKAEALCRKLLEDHPESAEAFYEYALIAWDLKRFDEYERHMDRCLELNPDLARAHLVQSLIYRMRQEQGARKKSIMRALACDPLDAEAHAAWAYYLAQSEGKLKQGAGHALLALELDPCSRDAHQYLGTGASPVEYKEHVFHGDAPSKRRLKDLLKGGDEYLKSGAFEKADRIFSKALGIDPSNPVAMIGRGVSCYHRKMYEEALDWFFRVLDDEPYYGLAHYGIARVVQRQIDSVNVRFAALEEAFAGRDAPEPAFIRDIFINYEKCDEDLRKIIRLSTEHLSNYMPALKVSSATVYLMGMHELLWQCPHQSQSKGRRTRDLRLLDDMKGISGYHMTCSMEELRDVKYLRANVVAHELAHQVHMVFSPAQCAELKRLFLNARREDRTLDWYANTNEHEYFAQGYEAFVSEAKLPDQKDAAGHTREELRERDPDLFRFIEGLNRRESYKDNMIMGVLVKGWTHQPSEAIEIYREGLITYGIHPLLLTNLGRAYRFCGREEDAFEAHRTAVRKFPDDLHGYLGLAEDYHVLRNDLKKAVKVLENVAPDHEDSAELCFHLGELYFRGCDMERMEKVLEKGLEIDPLPDPTSYHFTRPYLLLAKGRIAREDYPGAEKYLEFTLNEINRNNPEALAELALVCFKTGRKDEARSHLEMATSLDPKSDRVREVRAQIEKAD